MTVATAPTTIIIPAYRGAGQLDACIESVLRHSAGADAELLVIDDASPEPEVEALVASLPGRSAPLPIRVHRNEVNRGFVGTVNHGMAEAAGDVVLLNADTVVTAGWLSKLADAAAGPGVASVTPLTNEGSICTLPAAVRDAFALDGPDPRIDDAAAYVDAVSLRRRPSVISGVGFCMLITRESLDACGLFDEERYSPGYGEEVDFCLRATAAGFRHVVEDATFVYHEGGVSFADDRSEGLVRGSTLVHERFPDFRAANRRERAHDPLALTFANLVEQLAVRDSSRPHVLHLLHAPSRYGGTERYLESVIDGLGDELDSSVLHPDGGGFRLQTWFRDVGPGAAVPAADSTGEAEPTREPAAPLRCRDYLLPADEALETATDLFPPAVVHIENLIGHPIDSLERLRRLGVPVVCSLHDLYLACPHHWLLFRNEVACGVPTDTEVCARCLPVTSDHDVAYLESFRATIRRSLDVVDTWVAPSRSAADQFCRVYGVPDDRIEVIPHGSVIDVGKPERGIDEQHILDGPFRVGFVGRGWTKKGLRVADRLAADLRDLPIEVHHFGELREPAGADLVLHGPYVNHDLPRLLRRTGIHVVLIPGPYAETFGLVLTESEIAGIPVIGPPYGAVAERIRTGGVGWTVDPHDPDAVAELVRSLHTCRYEVLRASRRAATTPIEPMAVVARRYGELYRELLRGGTPGGRTITGARGGRPPLEDLHD